jgi:hypothetical protein
MITFIAIPKPFKGHIGIIQTNAIKSWSLLLPKPEIILMGREEGTKEIAAKFNLRHIPNIEINEFGTPLYSSIFREAKKAASNDWLCHITSDVILTNDFLRAFTLARKYLPSCFMVARRRNLDIKEPIDFSTGWEEKLKSLVGKQGKHDGHTGSDIYVFPKEAFDEIPPFTVRPPFDNWLFYYVHTKNISLVDITDMVYIIHQYHDYSKKLGGQKGMYTGIEAKRNFALAGGYPHLFTIRDANYELKPNGLVKKKDAIYSIYRWLVTDSGLYWLFSPLLKIYKKIRTRLSLYRA